MILRPGESIHLENGFNYGEFAGSPAEEPATELNAEQRTAQLMAQEAAIPTMAAMMMHGVVLRGSDLMDAQTQKGFQA